MINDSKNFAKKWIEAWNSHDIDKILEHYSDDFEITTPMIKKLLGDDSGTLYGKKDIKKYWKDALKKVPDLHFELLDVAVGVSSITLYYKSVLNTRAMEVMFFDDSGKVCKVIAHYTND